MFKPIFSITPALAKNLMHLEALKQEISTMPITPTMLTHLRESARIISTHYSTKIEGNRLSQQEVAQLLSGPQHFPKRERDEKEILGYYAALEEVERLLRKKIQPTQSIIQKIHALVMGGGKKGISPTIYRDGQNVIRDGLTGHIVYLPPEAKDVEHLMQELLSWLKKTEQILPCPIRASIAHYQFATIHPYYDGNGRTARLLTTFLLHLGGYDLNGIYSLEEYYAKNLPAYYNALAQGPSHNYYEGRADADITSWIEYFCAGMVTSFEKVKEQAKRTGSSSQQVATQNLSQRQHVLLTLFSKKTQITSHDVKKLFKISPRTARAWCLTWVEQGFLIVADLAKKSRKYELTPELRHLFK